MSDTSPPLSTRRLSSSSRSSLSPPSAHGSLLPPISSSSSSASPVPSLGNLSSLVSLGLSQVAPSSSSKPGTPLTSARSVLGRKSDAGCNFDGDSKEVVERGSIMGIKSEHNRDASGDAAFTSALSSSSSPLSSSSSSSSSSSASASASPLSSISSLFPVSLSRRLSRNQFVYSGLNNQFKALFESHTVGEVDCSLSTSKVVEIDSTSNIDLAFQRILEKNILSAPVYIRHADGKKEYTGFLDVRDLVASIVYHHETLKQSQPWNESYVSTVFTHKFQSHINSSGMPLSIVYLSRRNPFRPVKDSTSLLDAAKLLAHPIHRLPVIDNQGNCKAILSQSSIINFLLLHKSSLSSDWKHTIGQTQLGVCRVISISSDQSAFNAFKLLDTSGVSGISVTDAKDGKLLGNTSARDLKLFVLNRGSLSLELPILEYLSQIRQRSEIGYETHPSSSVSLSSTLGHVVESLNATKHHRVFIVDGTSKPIGVISISDIIRFAVADKDSHSGTTTPRKN